MKSKIQLGHGEAVLVQSGQHWAAFWPRFAFLLAGGALPSGFTIGALHRIGVANVLVWRLALAAAAAWLCVWFTEAVRLRLRYERPVLTITSRRVIAVTGRHSFQELDLDDLVDVSTVVEGPLAILLRYGDVVLSGGDQHGRITARALPAPERLARLIVSARERAPVRVETTEILAISRGRWMSLPKT